MHQTKLENTNAMAVVIIVQCVCVYIHTLKFEKATAWQWS